MDLKLGQNKKDTYNLVSLLYNKLLCLYIHRFELIQIVLFYQKEKEISLRRQKHKHNIKINKKPSD